MSLLFFASEISAYFSGVANTAKTTLLPENGITFQETLPAFVTTLLEKNYPSDNNPDAVLTMFVFVLFSENAVFKTFDYLNPVSKNKLDSAAKEAGESDMKLGIFTYKMANVYLPHFFRNIRVSIPLEKMVSIKTETSKKPTEEFVFWAFFNDEVTEWNGEKVLSTCSKKRYIEKMDFATVCNACANHNVSEKNPIYFCSNNIYFSRNY